MGLLDDAIREHLELKRQQGAASDEIERLEGEAFGPASRPGEPDFPAASAGEQAVADPVVEEPPTTVIGETEPPPGFFDVETTSELGSQTSESVERELPSPEEPVVPEAAGEPEAELAEDTLSEPRPGLFDIESTAIDLDDEEIAEPSAGAPGDDDPLAGDAVVEQSPESPAAEAFEPPPTTVSRLPEEELIDSLGQDSAGREADPVDEPPIAEAAPPPSIEEPPPTTISPVAPSASAEPATPEPTPVADDAFFDAEAREDELADDASAELDAEAELEEAPAPSAFDEGSSEDDFADIELDVDDDLEPPDPVDPFATVEHPSARPEPPPGSGPPTETRESPAPDDEDDDVLEETPDFLREQPEDDELWFEQGKPKDFDF